MVDESDRSAFESEVAQRLASSWERYWQVREMRREEHSEASTMLLTEQALPALRLGLLAMQRSVAGDLDDQAMNAAMAMTGLAEHAMMLGFAAPSEQHYEQLGVRPRRWFEDLVRRGGIADWSADHGAPLVGVDGVPIRSGSDVPPPLPTEPDAPMAFFAGLNDESLTPLEEQIRQGRDAILEGLADALPRYGSLLVDIGNQSGVVQREEATSLFRLGMDSVYRFLVGGGAAFHGFLSGREPPDEDMMFAGVALRMVGHGMLLVWGTDDPVKRSALPLIGMDAISELVPTRGVLEQWLAANRPDELPPEDHASAAE